jgi:hypothetical protein
VPDASPIAPGDDAGPGGGNAAADGGAVAAFTTCAAASARPSVRFCDDFEDGDVSNDWTVTNAAPSGGALVDLSLQARSGMYALYATTEATGQDMQATASLRKTVAGATTRAELSFALFLPTTSVGKGAVALATLDVTTSHFFTLNLRDADPDAPGPSLEETKAAGTTRRKLASAPRAGAWTRVTISLDLGAGKADVAYDGVKVLEGAPIAAGPGTEATFRVGAVYVTGPTPKIEVVVDDVLLETW